MIERINKNFVCLWRNIHPDQKFPDEGSYGIDAAQLATQLENGTAPQNVATYFCTAEGAVRHGAPGFWKPADYLKEMELAFRLLSSDPAELEKARLEAIRAVPAGHPRVAMLDRLSRNPDLRVEGLLGALGTGRR